MHCKDAEGLWLQLFMRTVVDRSCCLFIFGLAGIVSLTRAYSIGNLFAVPIRAKDAEYSEERNFRLRNGAPSRAQVRGRVNQFGNLDLLKIFRFESVIAQRPVVRMRVVASVQARASF